jgi:hypothetical protein
MHTLIFQNVFIVMIFKISFKFTSCNNFKFFDKILYFKTYINMSNFIIKSIQSRTLIQLIILIILN